MLICCHSKHIIAGVVSYRSFSDLIGHATKNKLHKSAQEQAARHAVPSCSVVNTAYTLIPVATSCGYAPCVGVCESDPHAQDTRIWETDQFDTNHGGIAAFDLKRMLVYSSKE